MYAIETQNLTKHFPGKVIVTKAVDNVSVQVKKSEIVCVVGPNGAGKTTFLKILSSLILPDMGNARINGFDILKQENKVKESVGFVSGDERSFYWRLTGKQNLEFFACLYNVIDIKNRIAFLMDLLKIEEPDKKFGEYSTGMKQKFGICRAMLHNPEILIMDEPTKSLDTQASQNIRKFLKEELAIKQGKTILFATHNMEEAGSLADRTLNMEQGRIHD